MDRPDREKIEGIIDDLMATLTVVVLDSDKAKVEALKDDSPIRVEAVFAIRERAIKQLLVIPDEEEIRNMVKAIQNPYTTKIFPRDDKWAGQILREKGLTDDEIGGVSGALGRVAFEYIMAEIDRLLEL